jgi:hypothetical protein
MNQNNFFDDDIDIVLLRELSELPCDAFLVVDIFQACLGEIYQIIIYWNVLDDNRVI